MLNLWGNIEDATEQKPHEILCSQVDVFNEKFGRLLTGDFAEYMDGWKIAIKNNGGGFVRLLTVNQVDNYPCAVEWEGGKTRAKTEAEFIGLVAKILNHQKTKLAIAELLK